MIDEDDSVELLEIEVLITHPVEDFVASGMLADVDEFGVHHAAGGRGIEGEKFADFLGFLIGHFVEKFFGGFLGKIGEEVGSGVGSHFLDDVGGFFGIESFDDLRGEALVEFGKDSGSGFFVKGCDDSLALGGGEFFHHFSKVGRMQVLKLFVSDTELDATKRVGLDEIHEFPADGALREPGLESTNHAGRSQALKKAADGAGKADVDLSDAKFDMIVGAEFGEVDVIDAHDFAACSIDDLLIEEILLDGEPAFVRQVGVEGALVDGEIDAARGNLGDLIVTGNEGLKASARDKEMRDAIGLVGRFDKEFADAANEIGLGVVGGGTHEFGGVEHEEPPFDGNSKIETRLTRERADHFGEWTQRR